MTQKQREKLIQYLNEAHATELALVRTLEAHLEVTPDGDYRAALAEHVRETREHAERVEARLGRPSSARRASPAPAGSKSTSARWWASAAPTQARRRIRAPRRSPGTRR